MNTDNYFDGFLVHLVLDEDGDFLAYFAEKPEISAFGNTPELAIQELQLAWKGIKLSYINRGEEIPIPHLKSVA